jgi:hypothetical protein
MGKIVPDFKSKRLHRLSFRSKHTAIGLENEVVIDTPTNLRDRVPVALI